MISILLADDHAIVRKGFKMILEQQRDFAVVGEAATVQEAMDKSSALVPDVLVTDVSMDAEKSGLLLVERIHHAGLSTQVVVLTMHEEREYLYQALELGALGYVLKSSSDDELVKAIRHAAAGEFFVCENMTGALVNRAIGGTQETGLTPRETEIVTLSVKGHSNQDIADALSISPKTVEGQKTRIMQKLGLASKPELFDYAATHGLLHL
ncbi:MAG: response regulator transcription factor [Eggerthellaceae bacterium]|jgi:two-component system response regulator NreC